MVAGTDHSETSIDILEELRWQKRYVHGRVPYTMERAAKEIERLREEVAILRHDAAGERKAHKVMTPEEYNAMQIIGWHEVCRGVDGCGATGIRFLT